MSEEIKMNVPLFNANEEAELENELLFHLDEFTNEIIRTMSKDKEVIILKKVIEKQQQEIEDLRIIADDIEEHNIVYTDTPEFEDRFISKDKIRERLKKLKEKEQELSDKQGYWGGSELQAKIEELEELLEE